MLIVDEVVGAYIAWGGRECLQRIQAGCFYVETNECEAGSYSHRLGGHISKRNPL